jgi:hypothetical protein
VSNDDFDQQDDERRNRENMTVLAIAAALVAIAVVLMIAWKHGSELLDCFAAGHKNCATQDIPQQQ